MEFGLSTWVALAHVALGFLVLGGRFESFLRDGSGGGSEDWRHLRPTLFPPPRHCCSRSSNNIDYATA